MNIRLVVALATSTFITSTFALEMPKDQEQFLTIVNTAIEKSKDAKNDMQRGSAKSKRDKEICKLIKKGKVNNWVGKINDIGANGDGKGILAIGLSDDIEIKTWNNAISDIGSDTLIEPDSSLFETVSGMSEGDYVIFSGSFVKENSNCVHEASMSLSGGLLEPEFIFRFSGVSAG